MHAASAVHIALAREGRSAVVAVQKHGAQVKNAEIELVPDLIDQQSMLLLVRDIGSEPERRMALVLKKGNNDIFKAVLVALPCNKGLDVAQIRTKARFLAAQVRRVPHLEIVGARCTIQQTAPNRRLFVLFL